MRLRDVAKTMKNKQLLIGGALLAGAVLLSRPLFRGQVQTDLKTKVEQKLASANPAGRFQDVRVADVDHMDVQIAGSVRTEQDRREVKPTVQSVPGVGRVTGDVAIQQAANAEAEAAEGEETAVAAAE